MAAWRHAPSAWREGARPCADLRSIQQHALPFLLGEFVSAIFAVSAVTAAGPNSRAAQPQQPRNQRRVIGIKDWADVCDFIYGLDDNWLEELL